MSAEPTRVDRIFVALGNKYVQRADDRQKGMGLQYTTAETHDLARFIDILIDDFDDSCRHGLADWRDCPTCTLRERIRLEASAIEARSDATPQSGAAEGESAVPKADAQPSQPSHAPSGDK